MIDALREKGWLVLSGPGSDRHFSVLIGQIERDGAPLVRDVKVASAGCGGNLLAHEGKFESHTDGVFWALPPRWLCIQVLKAEAGGALHVLDLRPLATQLDIGLIYFGNSAHRLLAPVVDCFRGSKYVRYRRDYMTVEEGASTNLLDSAHVAFAEYAAASSHCIGELGQQDFLFLDNWNYAHCRDAFSGQRVIRRMWFGGSESSGAPL